MIRRQWQRMCLWFCLRQYDGAMARGDLADALFWQTKAETFGGWRN